MSRFVFAALPRRAVVLVGVALALAAAASAFVLLHGRAVAPVMSANAALRPDAPASGSAAEIDILLGLARDATREGRLVAPQGNNAYEYYLSVVQLDASNATALDALRETLPFAGQEIEALINRRQLDEARRELALLRDFDPTNYTLIILGSKLDAQQQIVTAADEAKAEAIRRRNG